MSHLGSAYSPPNGGVSIMKKSMFVSLFIATILLVAALSFCTAQDLPPRTQITHYLGDYEGIEAPVIDGIIDDDAWTYSAQGTGPGNALNNFWYTNRPEFDRDSLAQPGVVEGDELPLDADDLAFRVWTVYDDEYLYIAVEVIDFDWVNQLGPGDEDGATWEEDSVEIFIDGNHNAVEGNVNDHSEEYETGGQFVMTSTGARRDKEAGDPSFGEGPNDEWFASVYENEAFTGFHYEFQIKLSKIGNPAKGDTIGFNLAVNDDDDDATAGSDMQIRWTGLAHDESTYGDLYFGRREIVAFLTAQPIVLDGIMDEADWAKADGGRGNLFEANTNHSYYPESMEDLSFDFKVLHDQDFLYVAVNVVDDNVKTDTEPAGSVDGYTWHDDSVEVFLDGDYSRESGTNYGFGLGAQLVMTANGSVRGHADFLFGEEDEWFAGTAPTDNGYLVEFRFRKDAFFTPIETELIGFNIAINEDDNDEIADDRDEQMLWNGPAHRERTYGALTLGGAPTSVLLWELF